MLKIVLTSICILFFLSPRVYAEKAESFQQAKELSVQLGKPILLEFVHED